MKNRFYLVCGGLLLAAAVGLLWWSPREPREPVYDGKPLSYWCTYNYLVTDTWAPMPPPQSLIKDPNGVPFLIRALRRDSWVGAAFYRRQVLPKLPSSIKRHLPQVVDNPAIRRGAANMLSFMGARARPAVPELFRALKEDDDPSVRAQAIVTLTSIGRGDSTLVTALTEALGDKDAAVRRFATGALGLIGETNEYAVVALTGALRDKDRDVRLRAVGALGLIGEGGSGAATALTAALEDNDSYVRSAATNTLMRLYAEAAARAGVKVPSP
jgi:hypothetical protein